MAIDRPFDLVIAAPNPAVDSYYLLDAISLQEVNRAYKAFHTAGGKGNNMARAAVRLGARVLSLGIVGGPGGMFIDQELEREEIDHELVWTEQETRRSNTIAIDGQKDTTVILEPGEAAGKIAELAFLDLVRCHGPSGRWLVLNGSLPPDFPLSYYSDLIEELRSTGVLIGLDTAGSPLHLAAQAGPALMKVNRLEFSEVFNHRADPLEDAASETFSELQSRGLEYLIVTEGAEGAMVFHRDGTPFRVRTPVDLRRSSAGAGDTFMAALCLKLGYGEGIREAARFASAAAAANVAEIGCGFIRREAVEELLMVTELLEIRAGG